VKINAVYLFTLIALTALSGLSLAEERADVLERIAPIGQANVEGQAKTEPAAAPAPAAEPAAAEAPAAEAPAAEAPVAEAPAAPAPAAGGDVVAGHVDSQPADVAYSSDDWVHMGDQDITADTRQRHIFAKGSP